MSGLGWLILIFFTVDVAALVALLILVKLAQRQRDAESRRLWWEAIIIMLIGIVVVYAGLSWWLL